jgi:biopolymer transport protein ExbD
MAELNSTPANNGGKKPLRKTQSLRVDLTAMVDLAFLLVTFFMLTTTLNKPKAMDLAMPDDGPSEVFVPQSRTLTLCLGKDNKLVMYKGLEQDPQVLNYSKEGLRKALINAKEQIYASTGKDAIVVVKPSDRSKYGDLVNTLDELNITQNTRYAVVDITDKDVDLLKKQAIY